MYQVLARKYRPKNFHELLGQAHVANALINGIEQQRLHHAYLFTGTRGVGKTTIARILAKCLNCETGITSTPCGVCSTCQAIDAGRFIDLIEIDAASRTKVEDTRELLDNVPYAPTQGRYKVYLIDEVHMLSTHSFNALLKTLEEPPAHVKFLLATTDPQKLPITIISRCLQFVLRPLAQAQLTDYLGQILTKEQIHYQADALWQIASSAKGSVRDALSLTDQAIAFGNGQIDDETVVQMLGLIDQADICALLTAVYTQNTVALRQAIQQLRAQVIDAKSIFDSLADVLHQVALLQLLPDMDLQVNTQQRQALDTLARQLPAEMVQLYYEIIIKGRESIALANTPLQALEMTLLRLLAFKPLRVNQIVPQPAPTPSNQVTTDLAQDTDGNLSYQAPVATNAINAVNEANSSFVSTTNLASENSIDQGMTLSELINTLNKPDADKANAQASISSQDMTEIRADTNLSQAIPVDTVASAQHSVVAEPVSVQQAATANDAGSSIVPSVDNTSMPIAASDMTSPLALLEPPYQELTGEWTTEKWDYWVYQARSQGWLADDELVLAKRGVMVGDIQGDSQFLTDDRVLSSSATFEHLCQKLQSFFPNINISLVQPLADKQHLAEQLPELLQHSREKQAINAATQQIINQQVMQELIKQNASVSSVKLINKTS